MAMLNDYYCKLCDREEYDKWSDDVPQCCEQPMKPIPGGKDFEWGAPRTYLNLRDEPFSSKSELASYAKSRGLSLGVSSEKVGGARNDMYDNAGKIFSYKGSPKRGNRLYSEGVRRS